MEKKRHISIHQVVNLLSARKEQAGSAIVSLAFHRQVNCNFESVTEHSRLLSPGQI